MREEIEIANYGEQEAAFVGELWMGADFCHLFEAKHEVHMSKEAILRDGRYSREIAQDGREHHFTYIHGPRVRTLLVLQRVGDNPPIPQFYSLVRLPGDAYCLFSA